MTELHDILARNSSRIRMFVNAIANRTPKLDFVVGVDHGKIRKYSTRSVYWNVRRNNRPDAAGCELFFPIDPRGRARAVVVVKPARKTGSENPILDSFQ